MASESNTTAPAPSAQTDGTRPVSHHRPSSITSHGRNSSVGSRHGFSGRPLYNGPGGLEITDEKSTDQTRLPSRRAPSTFSRDDRAPDSDWHSVNSGASTPTRRSLDPSIRPASMRGPRSQVPWIGTFHFENKQDEQKPKENGADSEASEDAEKGKKEQEEKDPNVIEWEENDKENPLNWPVARRWFYTAGLGLTTFAVTFASSIFSTTVIPTSMEFGVSEEVMVLGTSLFVIGFAVGPIVWGPFSELFGRKYPLFFGYFVFAIFSVATAVSQTLYSVMLTRFFGGFFGSAPLAVIGGMLADMWDPVYRGYALCIFAGATFIGPVAGPIVGSYVTYSYLGWRWTEWLVSFLAFFLGVVGFLVIPETSAPILLHRRAKKIRYETKNWAIRAKMDEKQVSGRDILENYLEKPFKMIFMEPILMLLTLYMGLIYGYLYLFFEVFPITFQQQRGMSPGIGSLPFISLAVGVVMGAALICFTTATRFKRRMKEEHTVVPEERLIPMMVGSIVLPAGLFWFAWTSSPNITPWPQIVAAAPVGMGIMVIFMQGLNYIIDVYKFHSNSAIAANTFVRSLLGGGFPMFAMAMFKNLGVPWATSLLGFLCIALAPCPFLFYIYGEKIRSWSKYAPK